MKARIRRRRSGAFTLIEVIVALAIASGALILLLSVNSESLQRSIRARQDRQLDRRCESALEQWRCGEAKNDRGEWKNLPGWHWEVRRTPGAHVPIEGLKRFTFRVHGPRQSIHPQRTFVFWRYMDGKAP